MKIRLALFAAVMLGALALAQDAFSPARVYKVGEKDVYGLNMKMNAGEYDVTFAGKLSYEVKKTFDNGDADLESKFYDITANILGQESKQPDAPAQVRRYDKFGMPTEKIASSKSPQPAFMSFLAYRSKASLKVGESAPIDEKLEDELKTQIKGSAKLEAITDGMAKIVTSVDISNTKTKKPVHLDSITYIDTKTSKLNRAESKVTGVEGAGPQGLEGVQSITVVLELVKS